MNCPHCNSPLLFSEERGAHCDGCEEYENSLAASPSSEALGEPRAKTLLRSMLAALDASDEVTYFACFEELQKVTLEMLVPQNAQGVPPEAGTTA